MLAETLDLLLDLGDEDGLDVAAGAFGSPVDQTYYG